jgi:hypothetical protein
LCRSGRKSLLVPGNSWQNSEHSIPLLSFRWFHHVDPDICIQVNGCLLRAVRTWTKIPLFLSGPCNSANGESLLMTHFWSVNVCTYVIF